MQKNILKITICFLFFFVFWLTLSTQITHPFIFPDENIYTQMAKSFCQKQTFLFRGKVQDFPPVLYSVLTAPLWKLSSPSARIIGQRVINSLLVAIAVFPLYWLSTMIVPRKRRWAAIITAMLLPGWMYVCTNMSENAFYPLFLCVIASIYAYIQKKENIIYVIIFSLFAFYAKPHILLILPGLILFALLLFVFRKKELAIKTCYSVLAVLSGPFSYGIRRLVFDTQHFSNWKTLFLGTKYAATPQGSLPFDLNAFLIISCCLVFIVFLPFLFSFFRSYKLKYSSFQLMVLCIAFGMIIQIAYFTVTHGEINRVHERYLFPIIPLIVIVGMSMKFSLKKWWIGTTLALILLSIAYFWIAPRVDWPISTDSPTLVAFFVCKLRYGINPKILVPTFLLFGIVVTFILSRWQFLTKWWPSVFILILTLFSFYGYKTIDMFQAQKGGDFRKWIAENVAPQAKVVYIVDGYSALLRQRAYMSEMYSINDTKVITTKTPFDKNGQCVLVFMNGMKLAQQPLAQFEDASVYFVEVTKGGVINPE